MLIWFAAPISSSPNSRKAGFNQSTGGFILEGHEFGSNEVQHTSCRFCDENASVASCTQEVCGPLACSFQTDLRASLQKLARHLMLSRQAAGEPTLRPSAMTL